MAMGAQNSLKIASLKKKWERYMKNYIHFAIGGENVSEYC